MRQGVTPYFGGYGICVLVNERAFCLQGTTEDDGQGDCFLAVITVFGLIGAHSLSFLIP